MVKDKLFKKIPGLWSGSITLNSEKVPVARVLKDKQKDIAKLTHIDFKQSNVVDPVINDQISKYINQ